MNTITGPLFTPPTERGTLNLPGWAGGGQLVGRCVRPRDGLFYVPSITSAIVVKLNPPDAARSNLSLRARRITVRQAGQTVRGIPLFKPPYGRITAIDLNTGEHAWMIPHGDGPRKKISELVGRDVGPLGSGGGGPLLTKTLLFIGQGAGGRGGRGGGAAHLFRAVRQGVRQDRGGDSAPASPSGTPMTFLADGKQYIALATNDGKIVAYTLGE